MNLAVERDLPAIKHRDTDAARLGFGVALERILDLSLTSWACTRDLSVMLLMTPATPDRRRNSLFRRIAFEVPIDLPA